MDHSTSHPEDSNDERVTVLRAIQGERAALTQLINAYDQRLLYFLRRMLGENDATFDVLQSVWLSVYRKLGSLRAPEAFKTWLYRLAHDMAVTELRRRSRGPVFLDEELLIDIPDEPPTTEVAAEQAERIHQALRELSLPHRQVLTLKFLEEMTVEEIAEVVGSSPGTVKSRLHYAKLALRRRIEGRDDDNR